MDQALRDGCEHRLGFPQHFGDAPAERLTAVSAFMQAEGLGAEFYLSGDSVERLERKVARLLGKPAALWCPTGTMAQGIAVRLHAEQSGSNRLLLHPTSHLELHENEGYAHLHGLEGQLIGDWSRPLAARDLTEAGCAIIELPQRHNGGALPDWEMLTAIKERAAALGLPLHMDGARLWSCRPAYDNRSFAEICAGFASVYVSLYKDIGAVGGAVLAGDEAFVEQARIWRSRMGGLVISPWPAVPDALRLLDTRLEQMPEFVRRAQAMAALIGSIDGAHILPTQPRTNMFHVHFDMDAERFGRARDAVAREMGVWLGGRAWSFDHLPGCALEVGVGERACEVPDAILREAFERLLFNSASG